MANKVLSIYVGIDAIRVAEMQLNSNKTVILSNAAEISTPSGSVNDGYLVDITAIAEAIRTSIFGRGFSAKDVIFTIQSKKIASKEVIVPYMKNEKRMLQILQSNSSDYFPMSNTTDYVFSYSVLENFNDDEGKKTRVSAVAAPADMVRCYNELARELKFNVKNIDYFGNSVIQLLTMQMQVGRTDLVLQVENDATYVNVMRGKTLILQRNIPQGKNAVINALMDVKKISEKDAKTLLSNETLLDQHVTADEYGQAVTALVQGIGKVVEYHRSKNKDDLLQGIKIFGEGSAIAGIEKILERELGAPVEHFETLAGVTIKGQAALTAEEVLRYLPNIGAVINPMDLRVTETNTSGGMSSAEVTKYMIIIFAVVALGMIAWVTVTLVQNSMAKKEKTRIEAEIEKIKDIEEIANLYEASVTELGIVQDFEASTHSNNEYLLDYVEYMEEVFPKDTTINNLTAEDGHVEFEVTTGWHDVTKNEIADVIVKVKEYEYALDYTIESFKEEYRYLIVDSYENGEPVFRREADANGEEGEYIEVDPYDPNSEYLGEELYGQIQAKYTLVTELGEPVVEETVEETENPLEPAADETVEEN